MKPDRKIPKLPDSELDIMLILWQSERPAKIIDIYNGLKTVRPCTKPAIHSLLENLRQRGFVKIEYTAERQSCKLITPLVAEQDYRASEADSFVRKLCGGKWQSLITALVDTEAITQKDIDEITGLLRGENGGEAAK